MRASGRLARPGTTTRGRSERDAGSGDTGDQGSSGGSLSMRSSCSRSCHSSSRSVLHRWRDSAADDGHRHARDRPRASGSHGRRHSPRRGRRRRHSRWGSFTCAAKPTTTRAARPDTSPTSSSRPDARGRGVGETLLAAAEQWARGLGYSLLTLNVFIENTRARALYERAGFGAETIRYVKALQ